MQVQTTLEKKQLMTFPTMESSPSLDKKQYIHQYECELIQSSKTDKKKVPNFHKNKHIFLRRTISLDFGLSSFI